MRVQCSCVRGLGRVRGRVQLPLLELPCGDRLGILALGEIEPEKLSVTKGAGSLLVEGDPDASHAVRCGECFSRLYWTGYEGKIRVPYGSLIDEPALKPAAHMFVGSKAPWYEILDDLPQHDEHPWP